MDAYLAGEHRVFAGVLFVFAANMAVPLGDQDRSLIG
jgi:hypothetical protein